MQQNQGKDLLLQKTNHTIVVSSYFFNGFLPALVPSLSTFRSWVVFSQLSSWCSMQGVGCLTPSASRVFWSASCVLIEVAHPSSFNGKAEPLQVSCSNGSHPLHDHDCVLPFLQFLIYLTSGIHSAAHPLHKLFVTDVKSLA